MSSSPPRRFVRTGARPGGARQRVLAAWRGIDLAPLEKGRAFTAKSVAAALPNVLKDLRMDHRRAEAEVVRVWNELLDPTLCAHAQPTGLRKGTLFVTVDSNVWHAEIMVYHRKKILDHLQNCFSRELIARISFRVG